MIASVEHNLNLHSFLIKEYFPTSVVILAIFNIYQNLLSVKFIEVMSDHPLELF